jgi:hypothetical protein
MSGSASTSWPLARRAWAAQQLMRTLGLGSHRTAWFMPHRIREAMKGTTPEPTGSSGAYFGKLERRALTRRTLRLLLAAAKAVPTKRAILGLVERGGKVRTFHIHRATANDVRNVIVPQRVAQVRTAYRRKPDFMSSLAKSSTSMRPSIMPVTSTFMMMITRTPSKTSGQCSSAVCTGPISIAVRLTCTATSLN